MPRASTPGHPTVPPVPTPPELLPLVGRHPQLAQMRELLARAKGSRGSTLALTGPGGIGKTRLLRTLGEEARDQGFEVRWGYCLKGTDTPFFALLQLLPAPPAPAAPPGAPRTRGPEPPSPILSRLASLPIAAARAEDEEDEEDEGNGEGLRGGGEGEGASTVLDPQLPLALSGRWRDPVTPPALTLLRLKHQLEQEAARAPLLLLLDDAQWADPQSLQALEFLARNLGHLRAAMVVAMRDDVLEPGRAATEQSALGVLDHLQREGVLRTVALAPLTRTEVRRFASNQLGGEVASEESESALHRLTERSGGIPYFVGELLSQLREEGCVRRVRGGWSLSLPASWRGSEPGRRSGGPSIPTSLQRLLRSRVEGLSLRERSLLDAASVLGSQFEIGPVAAAAHLDLPEAERLARHLSESGTTLRAPGAPRGPWSFSHALLWEFVLHEMPAEALRQHARELAAWWEEHRPADTARVAALYYEAHEGRKGPSWVRRALEQARLAHAFEQVETYLGWLRELLLEQGTSPTLVVEEQLLVVEALRREGPQLLCRRILDGVRDLPMPPPLRGEVEVRRADAMKGVDPEESRAILAQLESGRLTSGTPPTGTLLGRIRAVQAYLHSDRMEYDRVLERTHEALELFGPRGDPYERSRVLSYEATALGNLGRFDEAERTIHRSGEEAQSAGLMGLVEQAMSTEASMRLNRGDPRRSYEMFVEAVGVARTTGHFPVLAYGLVWGGNALLELGEYHQARAWAEEAEALCQDFGLPRFLAHAQAIQASIALRRGDLAEALRLGKTALSRFEGFGAAEVLPVRLTLVKTLAARGESGAATKELRPLLADAVPGGPAGMMSSEIQLTAAELEEAAGRSGPAHAHLERARELARHHQLLLQEVDALLALAAWEERHGDPARSKARREEARSLLSKVGLEVSSRPPPLLSTVHATRRPRPIRAAAKGSGPSTGELALLHLSRHQDAEPQVREGGMVPPGVTQEGIGRALGVSQGRLAAPLQRLQQRGLVLSAVCHVQGSTRRRKAYALTRKGLAVAEELGHPAAGKVRARS